LAPPTKIISTPDNANTGQLGGDYQSVRSYLDEMLQSLTVAAGPECPQQSDLDNWLANVTELVNSQCYLLAGYDPDCSNPQALIQEYYQKYVVWAAASNATCTAQAQAQSATQSQQLAQEVAQNPITVTGIASGSGSGTQGGQSNVLTTSYGEVPVQVSQPNPFSPITPTPTGSPSTSAANTAGGALVNGQPAAGSSASAAANNVAAGTGITLTTTQMLMIGGGILALILAMK
jgi:hypothetical protein